MSYAPFWDFFDNINDEVDQFNRLLASNGYTDRVKVAPSTKALVNGSTSNQVSKKDDASHRSGLIFPSLFNSPALFSKDFDIVPPVDILDNDKDYELHVSIPGADKDNINLDFNTDKNEVVITGNIPSHENGKNLKVNERASGKFERRVSLPSAPKVDGDNIKASYENGVLSLKVPKLSNEKSNTRRIEITSSDSWSDSK